MLTAQPMPTQDPKARIRNFNEVALGYTEEQALAEADRCLLCKDERCRQGCPVDVDIKVFIRCIKERDFDKAIEIIKYRNDLPAICGRVCPQETQCQKFCTLGQKGEPVSIGRLERFVADREIAARKVGKDKPRASSHKRQAQVAVIGSGPAGLICAADLAKAGYNVTVFESLHSPGGVLKYGIPEFRLPKRIVDIEVDHIRAIGVNIEVNMVIGKTKTIDELRKDGFAAFFIGSGAGLPYFLGIEGENLNGVYSANEFLTRTNLMKAYDFPNYDTPIQVGERAAVIGGGNVAVDSARAAIRLGAKEVWIIYRRSRVEMPARGEEVIRAEEEGIKFTFLANPIRIFGNEGGWVRGIECIRNQLGEPDDSGRRRPVPIKGSEFIIEIDTVVVAIGQGPNPLLSSTIPELKLTRKGNIQADAEGRTSIPDVFAGGDIVTGTATVIEAMGAGKRAAKAIDKYLKSGYVNPIA